MDKCTSDVLTVSGESQELTDIDTMARIVNASRKPEIIGVILPVEDAADFENYMASKQKRGNDAALGFLLLAANILIAAIVGICAVIT